jgi:opacity protein-like surface antigen
MVRSREIAVLLASASTMVWASPALAGEASRWSGPYAGVMIGVDKMKADGSYTGIYPTPVPTPTPTPGPTPTPTPGPTPTPTPGPTPSPSPTPTPGPAPTPAPGPSLNLGSANSINQPHVGFIAGYDWQLGRVVIGAEVDVAWQGNGRNVFSALAGTPVRDEVRIKWAGHALARVGYDVGSGLLPYLTGGAVVARVNASHTGLVTPTEAFTWRQRDNRLSYTLGAGVEKQFADGRWSFRVEYLYDYWKPKHYDWVPNQRYSDIALRLDTVRMTLARRF